ncbi:MAG: EamA family transporter [Verrucomicrobiota bacterium]|jgi:transporter family protein
MGAFSTNWLLWSVLSALFAAATAILAKVGVDGINSNLATAIRTTVVLLCTWFIVAASKNPVTFAAISKKTWIFLTLSGIATGLSWVCYFRALQLGLASKVAPVDKLSVIFVIAFSALFLHEPVGWPQWVGGSLIVGGAVILACF